MYVAREIPAIPVYSEPRWYEYSDTIATWGMFAAVLGILWLEYLTYQKGAPQWPRDE